MDKELSKKLCEIVGIEPCEKYAGYYDENKCNHCMWNCSGCSNIKYTETYPDFEKPENFVKLLEIKIKKEGIEIYLGNCLNSGSYFDLVYSMTYREQILNQLIDELSGKFKVDKDYVDIVKQALKNEKWSY